MGKYLLASVLFLALPVTPVQAQSTDPFEVDSGSWKSFDRYKEEQKERTLSLITGNPQDDARARAAADAEEAKEPDVKPASVVDAKTPSIAPPSLDANGLAAPERPLAMPVMPGVNGGFEVHVDTTQDDVKPVAYVANIETTPDLQLPKQNWLNAAEAARMHAEGHDDDDLQPLNIRYSFLPGFEPPLKKKLAAAKPPAPPPPPPAPPKQDAAACAAIDAYKKRQLEAIQSDRQTLEALQGAIKQLGLQKELSFMAGQESKINTPENPGPLAAPQPETPPSAKP